MQKAVNSDKVIAAENRLNRSTIADAIKQFVLIVISFGLNNAYSTLAIPPDKLTTIVHIPALKLIRDSGLTDNRWYAWTVFALYVLIGARFILTNWLYLSTTYRLDNPDDLNILPDAIGIFLTAVLVGLLSYVASQCLIFEFFFIFGIILLVDLVFTMISVFINQGSFQHDDSKSDYKWVINNLAFFLLIAIVFFSIYQLYIKTFWVAVSWLTVFAFLNCALSFCVSYAGYFRPKRDVKARTKRALSLIENTADRPTGRSR